MKKVIVLVSLLSSLAFAGKEERDFKANEVDPVVKTGLETFKKSCGCDVKTDVKWDSFKNKDQMFQVKYFFRSFGESSVTYCDTKESKKAMCALKSLEFSMGKESAFTFSKGKGIATTDGQSTPSFDMISKEVDK